MVSSVRHDALIQPWIEAQQLFEQPDGSVSSVSREFRNIFVSEDAFKEIPCLTPSHKGHSLVRFRGMVQDTSASPEFYLSRLKNGKCGAWGMSSMEELAHSMDVDYRELAQCHSFWAVSIPGQATWSTEDPISVPLPGHKLSSRPHKFPLHAHDHLGVKVMIYDPVQAEKIRSTDCLDFVGVLTSDDSTASPILHVIFSRPVVPTLLPRTFPYISQSSRSSFQLREELVTWIAEEALSGDRLVAEWILLAAAARVYSRHPPILPPSLCISRFPSPPSTTRSIPTLLPVLQHLLPLVSTLSLSLDVINNTSFVPESKPSQPTADADNEEEDELYSGWLQLPKGSLCIITESGIQEGNVTEKGLKSIAALQTLLTSQTLDYVFPYSSGFTFETDIVGVVLAAGSNSTFTRTSATVPLEPAGGIDAPTSLYKSSSEIKLPPQDLLDAWRAMLGASKIGNISVGEDVAKLIQEDFVRERRESASDDQGTQQTPKKKPTTDDLINRLVLARIMALTYQLDQVDMDIWSKVRRLEEEVQARIAKPV